MPFRAVVAAVSRGTRKQERNVIIAQRFCPCRCLLFVSVAASEKVELQRPICSSAEGNVNLIFFILHNVAGY